MASSAKLVYMRNDASKDMLQEHGDWYHVIYDGPKEFAALAGDYGFKAYAIVRLFAQYDGTLAPEITHNNLEQAVLDPLLKSEALSKGDVFQVFSQTCVPFGWQLNTDSFSKNGAGDAGVTFKNVLLKHDIKGGYCVPVHAPDGARSVIVYFGPRYKKAHHYPPLVLKSMILFEGMSRAQNTDKTGKVNILGAFEIQCLEGLAQGCSFSHLAEKTNLSEHAVRAAFSIIEKKLNARTPAHAMTIAMSKGLMKCPGR